MLSSLIKYLHDTYLILCLAVLIVNLVATICAVIYVCFIRPPRDEEDIEDLILCLAVLLVATICSSSLVSSNPMLSSLTKNLHDTDFILCLAVLIVNLVATICIVIYVYFIRTPRDEEDRDEALQGLPAKDLQKMMEFVEHEAESSTADCAICLEDVEIGHRLGILPGCRHGFHVDCICRWLISSATCPTCRARVNGMHELNDENV